MSEKEMLEKIQELEKRIASLEKDVSYIKEDIYGYDEEYDDVDVTPCSGHCSHCDGCE